ncbi:MAG: gluconate 2-dehydrogenase subunit 3 family protein [Rhizobiales bacterium]|nr:gluconate 2-dehydrogenase subunit 3 family protein [Hyphomicrobiales bacterium]
MAPTSHSSPPKIEELEPRWRLTRRTILRGLAFVVAAVGLPRFGSAIARAIAPPTLQPIGPLEFFTDAEYAFVAAASARFVPANDTGPGALEADAPRYIDRKLAAPGGGAAAWYMDGPFEPGMPTQGWQVDLTPAALYRRTIPQMNNAAKNLYGADFKDLSAANQDALLTAMQKKELDADSIHASLFFATLLNDTIEGLMSDPLYGGNKDFIGWKMIGFPGVRYNWLPWLDHEGEPIDLPIVGMYGTAESYGARMRKGTGP